MFLAILIYIRRFLRAFSIAAYPVWVRVPVNNSYVSTFTKFRVSNDLHSTKKIVSEYDQEIPQSQTADNPGASRGRAARPLRDTRKTSKATSSLFPFKMIAILERTQSNVQQNI